MNKILLIISTAIVITSIAVLLIKLLSTKIEISKIITISIIVSCVFIITITMYKSGESRFTLGFMITYIISQFAIILRALHLIKNEDEQRI